MITGLGTSTVEIKRVQLRSLPLIILSVLLLCSAVLNVVLARRIKNFNYAIAYLKTELSSARGLRPGDMAPTIQAKDMNGQPATLTHLESDSPSIVYVFTPSCAWCVRNLDNVRTLFIQTKSNYRFIGLSLSSNGLREYVSQYGLEFPVYSDPIGATASAYKGGTPRTLVISSQGKILESWFGAYTGEIQQQVERYFKTRLPGVAGDEQKENPGFRVRGACETCD